MRFLTTVLVVMVFTQLSVGCGPTTIFMKDGRSIRGTISDSNERDVKIGSEIVLRKDIKKVKYHGNGQMTGGAVLSLVGVLAILGGSVFSGGASAGGLSEGDSSGEVALGLGFIGGGIMLMAMSGSASRQKRLYESGKKSGLYRVPRQPAAHKLTLRF